MVSDFVVGEHIDSFDSCTGYCSGSAADIVEGFLDSMHLDF